LTGSFITDLAWPLLEDWGSAGEAWCTDTAFCVCAGCKLAAVEDCGMEIEPTD